MEKLRLCRLIGSKNSRRSLSSYIQKTNIGLENLQFSNHKLRGHSGCVNTLEFSDDGSVLISSGDDRKVAFWKTNELFSSYTPHMTIRTAHSKNIFSAALSSDNSRLLTSGFDGEVMLYDVQYSKRLNFWKRDPYSSVYHSEFATSNSPMALVAYERGNVRLIDFRQPEPVTHNLIINDDRMGTATKHPENCGTSDLSHISVCCSKSTFIVDLRIHDSKRNSQKGFTILCQPLMSEFEDPPEFPFNESSNVYDAVISQEPHLLNHGDLGAANKTPEENQSVKPIGISYGQDQVIGKDALEQHQRHEAALIQDNHRFLSRHPQLGDRNYHESDSESSSSGQRYVDIWDTEWGWDDEDEIFDDFPGVNSLVIYQSTGEQTRVLIEAALPALLPTIHEEVGAGDSTRASQSDRGRMHVKSCDRIQYSGCGSMAFVIRRGCASLVYPANSTMPMFRLESKGYMNVSTMKTGCWLTDDLHIAVGSEDMNVHVWRLPDKPSKLCPGGYRKAGEDMYVLNSIAKAKGHLSIVNCVASPRYSDYYKNFVMATSGIEKCIRLWTPYETGWTDFSEVLANSPPHITEDTKEDHPQLLQFNYSCLFPDSDPHRFFGVWPQ